MTRIQRELKSWILIVGCFFIPLVASATDVDLQQWTSLIVQKKISEGIRGYIELQPRLGGDFSNLDRVIFRPALLFPTDGLMTWGVGYAAVPAFQPVTTWEHRAWQQGQWDLKLNGVALTNRTRFEQRFLHGADEVGLRIRHQIRAMVPLVVDSPWSLALVDEIFFNLNAPSSSLAAGFDQNRAFIGVSWQNSETWRIETGYLLNSVNHPENQEDQLKHVWALNFFWNP